jgi:hypothetical protein
LGGESMLRSETDDCVGEDESADDVFHLRGLSYAIR